MKTRYFIFISFMGTAYHGWQLQPGALTVQKILNNALSVILREDIAVTGAGRTDAGVHASLYCAHFDSNSSGLSEEPGLLFRLNSYLPDDISVNSIRKVLPDANARYSAVSRTYKYYISRSKDPFLLNTSWLLYGKIDTGAMNRACEILMNHSDFTSFSKLHSGARTNICKIYSSAWTTEGNCLVFTIRADRFLRNMVRSIVGTMIDVGRGKIDLTDFEGIILARDRCRAGASVPAKGLFLSDIEYPEEIFRAT